MSLCSLHATHLLNEPKTLAQVHRACFFPRVGLLPRFPSPPNLRVAPAMSGCTGPAGKRCRSFGSGLQEVLFHKEQSLVLRNESQTALWRPTYLGRPGYHVWSVLCATQLSMSVSALCQDSLSQKTQHIPRALDSLSLLLLCFCFTQHLVSF